MQRYEKYKDSGIDWLGEIPEHWEVKRLGNWFVERKTKVSDKDYEPLSVTKIGVVPQLANAAKSNDGDNRKLVKRGDFVINSRSDRKGSSGLSSLNGSVSLINIVMEPRSIHGVYTNYLLKSNSFIEEFYRNGHGIVADLWTTRFDEMKFIHLAIAPFHEQGAIANFLDDKCEKIDAAVDLKEQQIEKLKELRQITIHNAVTKGIQHSNGDVVPMKDSGVDWIGEIPEHWFTGKFKHYSSIKARLGWKGLKADEYVDNSDFGFLSTPNIKNDEIAFDKAYFITKYRYDESPEIMLEPMDVLLVKDGSTLGISNIVKYLPFKCTVNSSIAVLRIFDRKIINPCFLNYVLKGEYIQRIISNMKGGMGVPHLFQSDIKNFKFFIPPISEQEKIVTYLDEQTSKIDKAIAQKQTQITKLKEYKQSLINEVVRGKVRVDQTNNTENINELNEVSYGQ